VSRVVAADLLAQAWAKTLAELSPPPVSEVYGVFFWSEAVGRHVVDEYDSEVDAEAWRDWVRKHRDASALLVHRTDTAGKWSL
jgi:hypothetical protein